MTVRPVSPESAAKLDSRAVLSAVSALCGPYRAAAALLREGVKLLVSADDWADAVPRLHRSGLPVRYFSGPFRDLFFVPGELVLLRDGAEGYRLLRRIERRWQYLDGEGLPLPGEVQPGSEEKVEAVVINQPERSDPSGSFASLAGLWHELRVAWAEVGMASLFVNAGQLLLPLFALLIYDKIALNGLFETLWALTIGMVLYLLTDTGMRLVRSWATERVGVDLALRSDESLWSKLIGQVELPAGGFPRFMSNYRDLTLSRDFVSSSYLLSIADIPFLVLYVVVIGIISWPLMVVTMLLVLIYSGVGGLFQVRQTALSREAEASNTSKLAFMGETLGSLDVVRTTPGSGAFLRRWRELAEASADIDTRRRLTLHHAGMVASIMQTVTTIVVLVAGVYLIYAQELSVGKLIACNLLSNRAMALVSSLFAVTGKWKDFARAAARMENSLEPVAERECTPRPDIVGNISVIAVGKHYEGRPAALEAVSLTIAPGERVALLGRPGAGKSTLLRCLGGLCRPDDGQILIDGLSLEDIARYDRVRWLAYKAQEPAIFAGTLEENLRVAGVPDQARFAAALWASGLEEEFRSGRMSLGMVLDTRGGNLSGGQRQKVALARVLAQPSRIMLLDEPTLGLDPEGERLLAERLHTLLDDTRILIMSTHSPVMLKTVQRVIALDGGRVVADGPREKLLTIT